MSDECLFALHIFAYNDGNFCLGAKINAMMYISFNFILTISYYTSF